MIKIGNRVKALFSCDGKSSIQYEIGKIIYIGRRALIEFDHIICGHNGNGLGAVNRCWMVDLEKIKPIQEVIMANGDCCSEAKYVPTRGLFEIHAINVETDEIVFTQKVVAEGEKEALFESDLKENLKKKELSKDDVHIIVTFLGSVPVKEKIKKVSLVEKMVKTLTGSN